MGRIGNRNLVTFSGGGAQVLYRRILRSRALYCDLKVFLNTLGLRRSVSFDVVGMAAFSTAFLSCGATQGIGWH